MLTEIQKTPYLKFALDLMDQANIALTSAEKEKFEFADFGLNDFDKVGLIIQTYVNTERVCAKELVMLPGQTCPEHRHPEQHGEAGKEETFRCRSGIVYLYVEGIPTANPQACPPAGREKTYTVGHEVVLRPGEQYTLAPNTLHWFQAGPEGAIVSEFSTHSDDLGDIFTDPDIRRVP